MKLPTLEEFLNSNLRSSFVKEPGFKELYLRKGARAFLIPGETEIRVYSNVLDIARVESRKTGKGTFKNLIKKLDEIWDGPIYVEQVFEPRFAEGLERMGFIPVNPSLDWDDVHRNFIKSPEKGKVYAIR